MPGEISPGCKQTLNFDSKATNKFQFQPWNAHIWYVIRSQFKMAF